MSKILVNGHGEAFYSKINLSQQAKHDLKFIWKTNIFQPKKLLLKQENKTRKHDGVRSRAKKNNYLLWKQTNYRLQRKMLDEEWRIKSHLITKQKLEIKINDQQIIETGVNDNGLLSKTIKLITDTKHDIAQLEQNFYQQKSITKLEFLKQVKKLTKSFLKQASSIYKQASQFKTVTIKNTKSNFFKQEATIFKKYQVAARSKRKQSKAAKLEHKIAFFSKHVDVSYDCEFVYKNAQIKLDYLNEKKLINNKFELDKQEYLSKIKNIKKGYTKTYHHKLTLLKAEIKKRRNQIQLETRAGNASRQAKKVAYKNLATHYRISKKALQLEENKYKHTKNKFAELKVKNLQANKRVRAWFGNRIDDLLKTIPQDMSASKYWWSIVMGSIIPGFTPFLRKQYFKGSMLFLTTIIVGIILAWSFGAFPSHYGRGILGLILLGHDEASQNIGKSIIGITNGLPNDGRFFLVAGTVAIIMIICCLGFLIIQALNNINVTNLGRIGVRATKFRQQKALLKGKGLPYLISAPAIIFIIFIVVVPVFATLLISFTNINQQDYFDPELKIWKIADGSTWPIKWVGFDQYNYIFNVIGSEFLGVLWWTLIWTFASTTIVIFLGTILAIIVNQKRIKGKTLFRIIYILPWAIPGFITIMFFSILFEPFGIFNKIIGNKIFGSNREWLDDGVNTKIIMILLQGWLGHSYMFLLITGMMQSIPNSLYEAARVDGSSRTKQFFGITAPIIIAKIAPLLIGQFVFAFNNFGLIYLLNQGGMTQPGKTAGEFDIFISWVYRLITSGSNSKPGAAAAISLVVSIFTVTPSAILFMRSQSFRGGNF